MVIQGTYGSLKLRTQNWFSSPLGTQLIMEHISFGFAKSKRAGPQRVEKLNLSNVK